MANRTGSLYIEFASSTVLRLAHSFERYEKSPFPMVDGIIFTLALNQTYACRFALFFEIPSIPFPIRKAH
jgi:hypothetical protein